MHADYQPPLGPFPYFQFANVRREGTGAIVEPWNYPGRGENSIRIGTAHLIPGVFNLTPGEDSWTRNPCVWVGWVDYSAVVAEVLRLCGLTVNPHHWALCGDGNHYRLELASGIALWRVS